MEKPRPFLTRFRDMKVSGFQGQAKYFGSDRRTPRCATPMGGSACQGYDQSWRCQTSRTQHGGQNLSLQLLRDEHSSSKAERLTFLHKLFTHTPTYSAHHNGPLAEHVFRAPHERQGSRDALLRTGSSEGGPPGRRAERASEHGLRASRGRHCNGNNGPLVALAPVARQHERQRGQTGN